MVTLIWISWIPAGILAAFIYTIWMIHCNKYDAHITVGILFWSVLFGWGTLAATILVILIDFLVINRGIFKKRIWPRKQMIQQTRCGWTGEA